MRALLYIPEVHALLNHSRCCPCFSQLLSGRSSFLRNNHLCCVGHLRTMALAHGHWPCLTCSIHTIHLPRGLYGTLVSSLGDGSIVNFLDCPSLQDVSFEDIHVKVGFDSWCRGDMVWKRYGLGRGRVVTSGDSMTIHF